MTRKQYISLNLIQIIYIYISLFNYKNVNNLAEKCAKDMDISPKKTKM